MACVCVCVCVCFTRRRNTKLEKKKRMTYRPKFYLNGHSYFLKKKSPNPISI